MAKQQTVLKIQGGYRVDAEQIIAKGGVVLQGGTFQLANDNIEIVGPDGRKWKPEVVAAATAVQVVAATTKQDAGKLSVLQEIVKQLGLKPGDANPSAELLPQETGLGGLALASLMADNGDALITTPKNLRPVIWYTLAEKATEADIENQFINIHHLFEAQGANDYGFQDWRAPNMKFEDNHRADESWMLWKFSEAGGRNMFDKSGSSASIVWSARRSIDSIAYYQRMDNGTQSNDLRFRELPVRPVRRVSLSL